MKENAIIIDGVKHTWVKCSKHFVCDSCSLNERCYATYPLCGIFEELGNETRGYHFEILNKE